MPFKKPDISHDTLSAIPVPFALETLAAEEY
jgi:hypothetical protein